jgi:hypothetical protein
MEWFKQTTSIAGTQNSQLGACFGRHHCNLAHLQIHVRAGSEAAKKPRPTITPPGLRLHTVGTLGCSPDARILHSQVRPAMGLPGNRTQPRETVHSPGTLLGGHFRARCDDRVTGRHWIAAGCGSSA